MKYLASTIILLLILGKCGAQGISSDGREYFIGVLYPALNAQSIVSNVFAASYFKGYILVSAIAETEISISAFSPNGIENEPIKYHISRFNSKQIDIREFLFQSPDHIGVLDEHVVIHLVSSAPVVVTTFSGGICSGGSYLCLPLQCLGKRYVAMSYHDNPSGIGGVFNTEASAGFCMVIATENETHIAITPSVTTSEGWTGVRCGDGADQREHPVDILLHRGQSYLLKSNGTDGSCDLSGTVISANKPIAVLGGHENAYIDGSDIGDYALEERDFMIEQMIPYECWDIDGYVTIPFFKQTGKADNIPDELHIINDGLSENSIEVTTGYNQSYSLTTTPFQQPVTSIEQYIPLSLRSLKEKPFAVMQYSARSQDINHASPAPCMMGIVPRLGWKNSYRISIPQTPDGAFTANYVTITNDRGGWYQTIMVSRNGGPLQYLATSGLILRKQYQAYGVGSFVTYELPPGEYYFINTRYSSNIADGPQFMMYSYSYKSFNTSGTITPLSSGHAFYSNANPAGMVYNDHRGAWTYYQNRDNYWSYSIIDKCDHWEVRVISPTAGALRYIDLLDYPAKMNISIGRSIITQHVELYNDRGIKQNNEIICDGTRDQITFILKKTARRDSCSALIAVYDIYGNKGVFPIFDTSIFLATSLRGFQKIDTNLFLVQPTGVHQSRSGVLSIASGENNRSVSMIRSVYVKGDTSVIRVLLDSSNLPVSSEDKSAITIQFRFTPEDTSTYTDTIVITTDCPQPLYYYITAKGEWPTVSISDYSFKETYIGASLSAQCTIQNTGRIPFRLSRVNSSNDLDFKIDSNYNSYLPIILKPGELSILPIKFTPAFEGPHSAIILWETDIPPDDPFMKRPFSILSGDGKARKSNSVVVTEPTTNLQLLGNILRVSFDREVLKKVSVYDMAGREVIATTGCADRLDMSVVQLTHGIYSIVIITDSGIHTRLLRY